MVLANLGNCYARMQNYETARKYLLQAIELGQLHEWEGMAHYDLAKTYACLHLLEESKREFELCAERAVEYQLLWRMSTSGFPASAGDSVGIRSPSTMLGWHARVNSRSLPHPLRFSKGGMSTLRVRIS